MRKTIILVAAIVILFAGISSAKAVTTADRLPTLPPGTQNQPPTSPYPYMKPRPAPKKTHGEAYRIAIPRFSTVFGPRQSS